MNKIFIVMRESGEWDDYRRDPIKAFEKKGRAKAFMDLCNEEGSRILAEIKQHEEENSDLLNYDNLPDYEGEEGMSDEEFSDLWDERSKRDMEYAEKQVNIMKSHKYDLGVNQYKSLLYDYMILDVGH